MTSTTALSIAFIEKRPVSAARTLAAIDPGDAAALLETIPSRFVVRVFRHIDSRIAAAVTERMSTAGAAGLLRALDYPEAVAIVRLSPSETRAKLLSELSERLRRDFEISLSYPADTVGAHMSTAIMSMRRTATVGEALELIRRSPPPAGDVIFVMDKAKRLVGTVTASSLLRRSEAVVVGDIVEEATTSISARARLTTVADLEAWQVFAHLPVTNRQKQVIAVLSRRAMNQAFECGTASASGGQASITASIGEAFLVGTFGLAQLLADVPILRSRSESDGDRS